MDMSKKTKTLSDGIRAAVDSAKDRGVSRAVICRAAGMDEAMMSKFMGGTVGLQLDTLDRLGEALGLAVVTADAAAVKKLAEDAPSRGRPKNTVETPRKPKTTQGKAAPVKR